MLTYILIECRDPLLQFLQSIADVKAITCINKALRDAYIKSWIAKFILERNLKNLLRSFDLTLQDVNSMLRANWGSCLSGSSILQAYIGEVWEDSDLDIYIKYRGKTFDNALINIMNAIPNCDIVEYVPKKNNRYTRLLRHALIAEVRRSSGKKIQLIFVKAESASKLDCAACHIVPTFDLTVVQNYYSGRTFHSLYIKHVLQRRMTFAPHDIEEKNNNFIGLLNILRIKKYVRRGFSFFNCCQELSIHPLALLYVQDMFIDDEDNF
jgi:hypothetical protein